MSNEMENEVTLSVVGLGKLGFCTAVCLARAGYRVFGADSNKDYVDTLQANGPRFFEEGLSASFESVRDRLSVGVDTGNAVENSDVSFIIVPTPSKDDGAFSNKFVLNAIEDMAPALRKKNGRHIVNLVSTVSPGSCGKEILPFLEEKTGKQVGKELGFTYNPEFIAIGSVIRDLLNPDLVLIGESEKSAGQVLQQIYERVCDNAPRFCRTGIANAEIAKLAINCYCTMKISFANNLGDICSRVAGTDAGEICSILGHDSRIGGKYIKPGLGFGGPCFPRDNEAFMHFLENAGVTSDLQRAVVHINNRQMGRAVSRIKAAADHYGNRVALLGLAYKSGTYLTERSQQLDIARELGNMKPALDLSVYDPLASAEGPWRTAESLTSCVKGANVAVILTPWPEFGEAAWRDLLAEKHCIMDFWE